MQDDKLFLVFIVLASISSAASVCPDGVIDQFETCDDGNNLGGDGCTFCKIDVGFKCVGAPSVCSCLPNFYKNGLACLYCLRSTSCSDNGACFVDSSCYCDLGYTGTTCQTVMKFTEFTKVVDPPSGGEWKIGSDANRPALKISWNAKDIVTLGPTEMRARVYDGSALKPYEPIQSDISVTSEVVQFTDRTIEVFSLFHPIEVVMPYTQIPDDPTKQTSAVHRCRIWQHDNKSRTWLLLGGEVDEKNLLVRHKIAHFGVFAVMYSKTPLAASVWNDPPVPEAPMDPLIIFFICFGCICALAVCLCIGRAARMAVQARKMVKEDVKKKDLKLAKAKQRAEQRAFGNVPIRAMALGGGPDEATIKTLAAVASKRAQNSAPRANALHHKVVEAKPIALISVPGASPMMHAYGKRAPVAGTSIRLQPVLKQTAAPAPSLLGSLANSLHSLSLFSSPEPPSEPEHEAEPEPEPEPLLEQATVEMCYVKGDATDRSFVYPRYLDMESVLVGDPVQPPQRALDRNGPPKPPADALQ